jgi:hypothetical protein
MALILKLRLTSQNKELERLENEDVVLTQNELRRLRRTAEVERVDIAEARLLQKGYRYMS